MTHGTQTGALWQSRRVGWGGRWEGGSGSGGTWVHLWLILVDVWQKTTKFCKAIFLKLKNKSIKIWLTTKKLKNLPANAGDAKDNGLIPGFGRSPRVGNGNPFQFSWEFHGQRNLVCYSPRGQNQTWLTGWKHTHTNLARLHIPCFHLMKLMTNELLLDIPKQYVLDGSSNKFMMSNPGCLVTWWPMV